MSESVSEIKQLRLQKFREIDLYPVTCEEFSNSRSDFEVLEAVIEGGAKIIQLRDKRSSPEELFEKAVRFRDRTRTAGMLLIINDYIELAMAVDADGVHLGQEDLPVDEAARLFPDGLIGASIHSLRQALLAERAGADYINIGPIFPTETKHDAEKFIGPDKIKSIAANISIPFTVMGGINSQNINTILSAGADKVAMITGITRAYDIATVVKDIRRVILTARS
jgi:thiamine-phosphate pyrophosphorylase